MRNPATGFLLVVLISLSMTGCAIYDKYGHGRVVASKLDEASVEPVEPLALSYPAPCLDMEWQ